MPQDGEQLNDIAHLGAVELLTPEPAESLRFFRDVLGMEAVHRLGGSVWLRGYGDFVHYHLLGRGALDVVVESDVNILDIAALTVIVEEAGGRFTDLDGGPVGLDTTTVLASNGALHDTVLAALR